MWAMNHVIVYTKNDVNLDMKQRRGSGTEAVVSVPASKKTMALSRTSSSVNRINLPKKPYYH